MFTIVPRNTILPRPLTEDNGEVYDFFQRRQELHVSIDGLQVYINQYAWNAFSNHGMNVYKEVRHEAQGIFLGRYYKDHLGEFAVATEYCEGFGESSHAYVGMSDKCLAEISRKCSEEDLLMLTWIHTHPNFGVFYSGTDTECLKTNFFMPFQSGIVADIIRNESKGFKVENKEVVEFDNYFLYDTEKKSLSSPYKQDTSKKKAVQVVERPNKNSYAGYEKLAAEVQSLKAELGLLSDLVSYLQKRVAVLEIAPVLPRRKWWVFYIPKRKITISEHDHPQTRQE